MKVLRRLVKFWEENRCIILGLGIACALIFSFFILFDKPFVIDTDQQDQYHIFYREWIEMIRKFLSSGELPLFSWNTFLGTDFYSTQTYYVIGDIFIPLVMLFDSVEMGLLYETMLLIIISGITMNIFLKEYGIKSKKNRNFISIVYALSGFAVLFFGQYMFHRFYAFSPLLFFGMEFYLNRKKSRYFILVTTLLFLTSYYFMFQTSIFLLMYGIFTTVNRGMTKRSIMSNALKMVAFYLVGALLSGIVLVPSVIYLLGNSRVGEVANTGVFWHVKTYISFILSIVSPYFTDFPKLFYVNINSHDSWYSLFVGMVPAVLAFSLLSSKKHRNYSLFLYALIIIMIIKPLSSGIHGFSEPSLRWTCLLVFFLLLMSAKALEDGIIPKNKVFVWLVVSSVASLVFLFVSGQADLTYIGHALHIILSCIIGCVTYYIFIKRRNFGIFLTVVHLILNAFFTVSYLNRQYYRYDETINKEYVEYFRSIDDDIMYRMYVNNKNLLPTGDMNLNKSMDYNFMSVTSYNTVYDNNISAFLRLNTEVGGHYLPLSNPDIMVMLGVKYYIVYSREELPKSLRFEYAYNLDHLEVYKNLDFKGFGYSTSRVKEMDEFHNLNEFDSAVFVDDEIDIDAYKSVKGSRFTVYENNANSLKGYIDSESINILFIPIPNNPGWKAIVNGVEIETISVNGGFMGIPIGIGKNNVEIYFVSKGLKEGFVLTLFGSVIITLSFLFNKYKSKKL